MAETVSSKSNPVPAPRAKPETREVGLYQAEVMEVGTNADAKLKITNLDNMQVWAKPLDTTTAPAVGKICWMMFVPMAAGEVEHLYTWAQPTAAELHQLTARVAGLESSSTELQKLTPRVTALESASTELHKLTPRVTALESASTELHKLMPRVTALESTNTELQQLPSRVAALESARGELQTLTARLASLESVLTSRVAALESANVTVPWQNFTLHAGFTTPWKEGWGVARYRVVTEGGTKYLEMAGSILVQSGNTSPRTFAKLPEDVRPKVHRSMPAGKVMHGQVASYCRVDVYSSGNCDLYLERPADSWVSLDGIRVKLDE